MTLRDCSPAAGEVCLPGGKQDPEDHDDIQCALREAHEELGLHPSTVQIIAQLPPFISKHKLSVSLPALPCKVFMQHDFISW